MLLLRITVAGPTGILGRSIVKELARDGHRVAVIGRSPSKLRELARELEKLGLSITCTSTADLRELDRSRIAIAEISSCLGGMDVLINSAGAWDDSDPYSLTVNRWVEVYIINTVAPYMLSLEASRYMDRGGTIINIGCLSALRDHRIYSPLKPSPAYLASKVSITYLTKQLAELLAPKGIRVVTILPSWIDKPALSDELRSAIRSRVPLGRAADPGEVVEVIRSIIYMRTNYITGSIIEISGGL